MIETFLSRMYQPIRQKRTEADLNRRDILVTTIGSVPKNGLVVLTHPTIEDSKITRSSLQGSFSMVGADSLEWTRFNRVNQFRAIVASAMIPVYRGNTAKRQKTYELASNALNKGKIVTIAPTGRTTFSNEIPKASELKVGGIIRTLRAATRHNTHITPAVRYVDDNDINNDGTIKEGSRTYMIFGDSIEVPKSFLNEGKVSEEEVAIFSEAIVKSWREAVEKNKDQLISS